MKRITLQEKDRLRVHNLQLQAENHRLQSLIYEMQLTQVVNELGARVVSATKEFDPVTLTWMVGDDE